LESFLEEIYSVIVFLLYSSVTGSINC